MVVSEGPGERQQDPSQQAQDGRTNRSRIDTYQISRHMYLNWTTCAPLQLHVRCRAIHRYTRLRSQSFATDQTHCKKIQMWRRISSVARHQHRRYQRSNAKYAQPRCQHTMACGDLKRILRWVLGLLQVAFAPNRAFLFVC